jgi:methionyl-tRNA synthetase
VIRFVEGGLQDLSVSRTSFRWGIPVPDDPGHVIYVWLDALTNYMSALGYPDLEARDFRQFWPADVHVVGKDILRFHAVYWPAFLLAAEIEPPRRVVAHGWWTVEGQKISKSLGNVIDPWQLIDTYGLDQTRYFLLREVPFGNDGDFSHAAMINRMNRDLANDYGNLVQRVLSMIQRYCEGRVPEPGPYRTEDKELTGAATRLIERVRGEMANQALSRALEAIFEVIGAANRYVDAQAPWALRKDDPSRAATVLYVLAETIRHIAVPSQAFLPDASGRILDQLAVAEDARTLQALTDPSARLRPGTPLPRPAGVFPRYAEPGEATPG